MRPGLCRSVASWISPPGGAVPTGAVFMMPPCVAPPFETALQAFATEVTTKFAAQAPGQPEDQLRAPLEVLLKTAGPALGKSVIAKGESLLPGRLGKPDYAILIDAALSGYIELKAPGRGANPNKFSGHDRDQWNRFKSIPNLLYTDGNEWALYRVGEREGKLVRLPGDVSHDAAAAVDAATSADLVGLLTTFFAWQPIVPSSPAQLAEVLAPVCRLLRDQVRDSLKQPTSPLIHLATDWRALLFPEADDDQFADAYAQTVTYALLLAQADGATSLDATTAATTLGASHALLARALQVLTDQAVDAEIGSALRLVQRVIGAVNPNTMKGKTPDPWLYFYEDFLAAYDPTLRRNAGVYYTPVEVVRCQVRLADDLLRRRLGKPKGFAESGVQTLDPGVGTGTYLLGVIAHALADIEATYGIGAVAGEATALASALNGFELLVGPYAVAQLRISREIERRGGSLPSNGPHIFLTDTLEDPATVPKAPPLFYAPIAAEHSRAQEIKDQTPILVCIGNPPYDRHDADSALGGWIRHATSPSTKEQEVDKLKPAKKPPLDDFLAPAREAGYGVHLKNIYNLYVYFWRWAIWKVFEHTSTSGQGIVTFISASSYLAGPGFVGMREKLRRECDAIWIIDLGGDNRGPRQEPNVFDIQVPVAIALAGRFGPADLQSPAEVKYSRIRGTREEKLAVLDALRNLDDLPWEDCPAGWQDPMKPAGVGDFFSWPALTDVMPWQHSGVQVKRSWPIAPDEDTLTRRWAALMRSADRGPLFRETSARQVSNAYSSSTPGLGGGPSLNSEPVGAPVPQIVPFAFRSFDRQKLIADNRLMDRPRPALWKCHGSEQVYLTTLTTTAPLGHGPAATAAADLPDLHHFRGSYGGSDAFPLWRDAAGTAPNIWPGLVEAWSVDVGIKITPEALLAYIYAILACKSYTSRFWDELEIPGPRVPLTSDPDLLERADAIGQELLFLHTFGQRYAGSPPRKLPSGEARSILAVSDRPQNYPDEFFYDEDQKELRVGTGVFAPVGPDVWGYQVSGLQVVHSWLDFRMAHRGGRKSSQLDEIRPSTWTPQFTAELLQLLWILERTVKLADSQALLLEEIIAGPLFDTTHLPPIPAACRQALDTDAQPTLY